MVANSLDLSSTGPSKAHSPSGSPKELRRSTSGGALARTPGAVQTAVQLVGSEPCLVEQPFEVECQLAASDFVQTSHGEVQRAYLVAVDVGAIRAKKLFPLEVLPIKSLSVDYLCCEPIRLHKRATQHVSVTLRPKHFDAEREAIVALQIVRESSASGKDWWHAISKPNMVVVLESMPDEEAALRATM
eukprot:TRINITY_DN19363_c0_g3_i1.p1 TRINITY_DN19363_c0_g3~~TRINITY_DN19363_c0_g3_i1.p1  ORF type:complete len:188 (+),score=40.35 TRINITY_DN19363_c0_g3_i1:39-602(+)